MDIKATAFKRGNPPEERNGFFGLEEQLIENAQDAAPIVAIVTYRLDEVVSKAIAGETYPVVETFSNEPLHTADAIAAAVKLRDAALKARTGIEQLELPEIED
jgi:hypothetical protein